jgi:hypothetical protein
MPRLTVVLIALVALACARERPLSAGAPDPAPPVRAPAPAADLRAAERALADYLEASREGTTTAGALDTLLGCDAKGAFVLPIALLAAYRVLPASGAGDTLLGRAVVVTVAEQRMDRRNRDRYLARQRVEEDTLEWDLVRGEDGVGWQVCNGIQFGFHEPEEATTWFPLGASRASARRLADSIRGTWNGAAGPTPPMLRRR